MPSQSYRDYIYPTKQAYLSDRDVLEKLAGQNWATPFELAESRRRENLIRLQCRDLVEFGFVTRVSHDTFRITDDGLSYLPGDPAYTTSDGMFELDTIDQHQQADDDWRLTDFSILDPETIKQINYEEFQDGTRYGLVQDEFPLTKQRIWNVSDFQLNRVIREFPTNEPLPQQCAHWMRAFSGLHFFPDANHRTAMNTLQILVSENDCKVELPVTREIEWYVLQSKLIRHLQSDVRFNTLWMRDEHYSLWHRYFRDALCKTADARESKSSKRHLRAVLGYAREQNEFGRKGKPNSPD